MPHRAVRAAVASDELASPSRTTQILRELLGMDGDVAMWAGLAIFVGPIVAGLLLVFLRWQMERGPWWTWPLLVVAGVAGYYGYQHRQTSIPTSSPPSRHTARRR